MHRCDSIQRTDYFANPFFLNLRVSKTKIETLRWKVSGDIIQVTFGKFVTSFIQKLKKNVNKLICSQYLDSQFLWAHFSSVFGPNVLDHKSSEGYETSDLSS